MKRKVEGSAAMSASGITLVIAGKSFRRYVTYRAATVAGLVTNLFFGIIRAYLFLAAAKYAGGTLAGYSQDQLIAYSAWTQALIGWLLIFGTWDLMLAINSGDIAAELCRPINVYWSWQAADLGRAAQGLLFRGIPLLAGYALFFPLSLPHSATVWVFFLVSLVLAALISFAWRFMVNCLSFWTLQNRGLMGFLFTLAMFLGGFIIPLEFFPDWARDVLNWLPFTQMVQMPLQIVAGRVTSVGGLWRILAGQAVWVPVLWAVASLVWRAGIRKLVVQGG